MEKPLGGAGEVQGTVPPVSATAHPSLAWEKRVTLASQGCLWPCAGQGASDNCWVLSLSWIGQDVAELRGGKLTGKKLRGMIDSNCLRWKELIRAAHEHQVPN